MYSVLHIEFIYAMYKIYKLRIFNIHISYSFCIFAEFRIVKFPRELSISGRVKIGPFLFLK